MRMTSQDTEGVIRVGVGRPRVVGRRTNRARTYADVQAEAHAWLEEQIRQGRLATEPSDTQLAMLASIILSARRRRESQVRLGSAA